MSGAMTMAEWEKAIKQEREKQKQQEQSEKKPTDTAPGKRISRDDL